MQFHDLEQTKPQDCVCIPVDLSSESAALQRRKRRAPEREGPHPSPPLRGKGVFKSFPLGEDLGEASRRRRRPQGQQLKNKLACNTLW